MAKVIAIAGSDFHIHNFRAFNKDNSRLKNSLQQLNIASAMCEKYGVPFLFSGDLYHTPADVANETNSETQERYKREFEDKRIDFFGLSGNHDLAERNTLNHKSPSHLKSLTHFNTFRLCDYTTYDLANGMLITGIPYMNNESELLQCIKNERKKLTPLDNDWVKILLLHTDLPGAETPSGFKMGDMEYIKNINKLFKPWDLVLCGHIHKPKKLGKNVYMLGAGCHQDEGDMGCTMGLWKVYDDATIKFVPTKLPEFIQLKNGEEAKDDGNYYVPYEDKEAEKSDKIGRFNVSVSKKKLALRYCKEKGIKSKAKKHALIKALKE